MNLRWLVNRTNPEYISYISKAASISPILAQILTNRGIKTLSDINDFLYPGGTGLSDPFELPNIEPAIERIKSALARNERFLIHGDYDADGLTAAAIMIHALKTIGTDVHYFIPNRISHGYGFNIPSVDIAKKLGVKLIITVDCGITSFDAAAYAKKEGIDVIITDHHEPIKSSEFGVRSSESDETKDFIIPEAIAVINPKLLTQSSKLFNLSGAGIAFKVVQALAMGKDLPITNDDILSLLDLAALGTVADVVTLTGENRIILKEGLRNIHNGYRPGIRALKESAGINGRDIKARLLSFTLIPRINATGRISDAGDVVELFLSDSYEEALAIAEKLDRTNTERQRIEEEVYQQALSRLSTKGYDSSIVLYAKGWHIGVLGIVASRIAEEYFRPTFIFTIEDEVAKGSARSIPAFDIHNGLSACKDILLSFGGHKQAAGIKLRATDLPFFEEKINSIVRESLNEEDFIPCIEIDSEISLKEISHDLANELSKLEPLGCGNPEPLLGARKLAIINPRIVGNNHVKMKLRQSSMSIDTIGFNMGSIFEHIDHSALIDAAFIPTINEWNSSRYLQLNLKAIRPSK